MTVPPSFTAREQIETADRQKIFTLLRNSGFFYPREMAYGMDLLDEHLLKGEMSQYRFLLLENKGALLAYGCYGALRLTDRRFHLHWLAVDTAVQKQGLGFKLEQGIVERIKALNGVRIYADVSNRDYHAEGRAFYEKCGYQPIVSVPGYYSDGDDMVYYMKDLSKS